MITHGTRVILTNEAYGTSITGTLHDPEGNSRYGHVYTLILDDGRRYRNEGKLTRIPEEEPSHSEPLTAKKNNLIGRLFGKL